MSSGRRLLPFAWALATLLGAVPAEAAQVGPPGVTSPDSGGFDSSSYDDAAAERLHRAAMTNWRAIDESVVRYTAMVQFRAAAQLRTPLRDRTLYRSESAARVFWDRDEENVVQVLASREQTPAGVSPPGLYGVPDEAFDPAGDRLFFGTGDPEERGAEARTDDDLWFHHPLAAASTDHYRFRSGDTLTLSLPDGRALQAVELQLLPRVRDPHRLSGSLWIDPSTGALVRAAYRLADPFDAMRDLADVDEEDLDAVPGLFKPMTLDLSLVLIEYALWDFEVWLPRSLRMEGLATAGVLKAPATFEFSYRVESVVTEKDLAEEAAGGRPVGVLEERHFETRAEAMRFIAELIREREGVEMELEGGFDAEPGTGRPVLRPVDDAFLVESPYLPPPVWKDAPGFSSRRDVEAVEELLADLPQVNPERTHWAANWGLERPDLIRYNRVEGPAVGARLQLLTGSPVGPLSLTATPFLGVADLEPKVTLSAARESLRRRVELNGYRELQSAVRGGGHLGLGNSASALLFGRDDGEYFLATGAELVITPPEALRRSWSVRLYGERQESVETETDFTLVNAFDGDWRFRDNLDALRKDEYGVEVEVLPWWGTDPLAPQFSAGLYLHGATGDADFGRTSALLRAAVPFGVGAGGRWRVALEVEAGESWGDLPPQRNWFLGSSGTLRGYDASTLVGPSFARTRAEVARVFPAVSLALFSDAGWVGDSLDDLRGDDALVSVGVGASVLDGLLRLDVARGLRAPRMTRWDFYLDAAF